MSIKTCTDPWAAGYNPNTYVGDKAVTEAHNATHVETFVGAVLFTGEHNYYDDSDFYAIVWDDEKQCVREVEYASTRGWTYHNSAVVDATTSVRSKAILWESDRILVSQVVHLRWQLKEEAEGVHKGVRVRSTTTKGKNVGVEGVVVWEGVDDYRVSAWARRYQDKALWPKRYGVRVEGEEKLRYLSGDRVERTDKQPVREVTEAEVAAIAAHADYIASRKYGGR